MKCEHCQHIMPIEGFGGYLHFTSTKRILDKFVDMKMFEISSKPLMRQFITAKNVVPAGL